MAGGLAAPFGHGESFAIIDADPKHKEIVRQQDVSALHPSWICCMPGYVSRESARQLQAA